jgi:filamentous hemagglutinin family protein
MRTHSHLRLNATTALQGSLAVCLSLLMAIAPARANPQGGVVTAGSASIARTAANRLDIVQTTDKAIVNWQGFSIGAGEITRFQQPSPSSITLNRVVGGAPSDILGQLSANGQVWLVNPNGVFFGPGAQVNVGGLVATTHDIKDKDFLDGRFVFRSDTQPPGTVENQGHITIAQAGLAAFVAPGVVNHGTIEARLGEITLASGRAFTVDLYGDRKISLTMDRATAGRVVTGQVSGRDGKPLDALVKNDGTLLADGGRVVMTAATAKGVVDTVVNVGGLVQARTVQQHGGEIILGGDEGGGGTVQVTGTLDVSGHQSGQTGGTVIASAMQVAVRDGSRIDASGRASGGTVLLGGDVQGGRGSASLPAGVRPSRKPVPTAARTTVEAGVRIDASALDRGQGGTVVVWADDDTSVHGRISARGGVHGGDGGFIETSGHVLAVDGATIDAGSSGGKAGTWLLDPSNLTIDSAGATALGTALATSYIIIATSSCPTNYGTCSGTGGELAVTSPIHQGAGDMDTGLVLRADTNIYIAANITSNSTNKLDLVLNADGGGSYGSVGIFRGVTVSTNGGNITIGGGASPATTAAVGNFSSTTYANGPYENRRGVGISGTVDAGGGNIVINGSGCAGHGGCTASRGVSIGGTVQTSGTGTIAITGTSTGTSDGVSLGDSAYFNVGTLNNVSLGQNGHVSAAAGAITINGTAATTANPGVNIITGSTLATTGGGAITVTAPAGDMVLNGITLSGNGRFTASAGSVTLEGDVTKAAGGDATLLVQAARDIVIGENATIAATAGKLDVILRANTAGSGGGIALLADSSITSNGGAIALGGGSCGGCASIPDILTAVTTTGYAVGSAAEDTLDTIGTNGITLFSSTLTSDGGAITLRGKSGTRGMSTVASDSAAFGVIVTEHSTISAGAGSITITGVSVANAANDPQGSLTDYAEGVQLSRGGTTNLSSSGGITISGDASAALLAHTYGYAAGIRLGTVSIKATGSAGISLTGKGGDSSAAASYGIILESGAKVAAASGAIDLTATATSTSINAIATTAGSLMGKSTALGITSASDITLTGDTMALVGAIETTGTLTIQPKTSGTTIGIGSGTGTLRLPAAVFTNTVASIKVGNSTAGQMTFGGTTTLYESTTFVSGQDILFTAAGSVKDRSLANKADVTLQAGGAIQFMDNTVAASVVNAVDIHGNLSGGGIDCTAGLSCSARGNSTWASGIYIGKYVGLKTNTGDITLSGTGWGGGASGSGNLGVYNNFALGLIVASYASLSGNNIGLYGQASQATGLEVNYGGTGVGTVVALTGTGTITVYGDAHTGSGLTGVLMVGSTWTAPTIAMTARGSSSHDFYFIDGYGAGVLTSTTATTLTTDSMALASGMSLSGSGTLTIKPYTAGRSISIGTSDPGSSLFLNAGWFSGASPVVASGFSGLTVGASDAGAVTVSSALSWSKPLTLVTGGAIAINGAITLTGSTLALNTAGNVSQTAAITADKLELLGTGATYSLDNASNSIATLAGNTGSVDLVNNGSLTVGTVNTVGLTVSGTAKVRAVGATADLTLSQAVSAGGSGTAVVLAAGRTFINAVGSSGVSAASGRWLIYSADPDNDSRGGLTGENYYNCTYVTCDPSSGPVSGLTGNRFISAVAATLTVTTASASKTYGDADPTFTFTTTGLRSGDALADALSTAPTLSRAEGTTVAGGPYAISAAAAASALNYTFSYANTGSLTIGARSLTASVVDGATTYGAGASAGTATLTGVVSGDSVSPVINLRSSGGASVTLGERTPVGTYTQEITGITGAAAGNYTLAGSGNTAGTLVIHPKTVSWAVGSASSTYGTAPVLTDATLNGMLSGDTLSSSLVATDAAGHSVSLAANTPAGSYSLTASGLYGTAAGNYTLAASGNTAGTLTVSPKTLTWTVANASATYGTTATPGAASFNGMLSGDSLAGTVAVTDSAGTTATLAERTAAGSYSQRVTALSGDAAANYTLATSGNTPGTLTIAPKTLTWTVANASATYGTAATPGAASFNGMLSGDSLAGAVAVTDSAGTAVTLAGRTAAGSYSQRVTVLSGDAAANYTLATDGNTPGTLTITPKPLTWSVADASATYGAAATPGTAALAGVAAGDSLAGLVGALDAGGRTVALETRTPAGRYTQQVTGLTGDGASNYTLATDGNTPGTLTIAPKALTWTVADTSATYGTVATPGAVSLAGVVAGDSLAGSVGVSDAGGQAIALETRTPAGRYTQRVTGLTGDAVANYTLAASGNTPGTLVIDRKTLTWTVADASAPFGTTAVAGAATLNGVVSGDSLAGSVGVFDGSTPISLDPQTRAGLYSERVTTITGAVAGNYALTDAGSTPGTLTITASPAGGSSRLSESVADLVAAGLPASVIKAFTPPPSPPLPAQNANPLPPMGVAPVPEGTAAAPAAAASPGTSSTPAGSPGAEPAAPAQLASLPPGDSLPAGDGGGATPVASTPSAQATPSPAGSPTPAAPATGPGAPVTEATPLPGLSAGDSATPSASPSASPSPSLAATAASPDAPGPAAGSAAEPATVADRAADGFASGNDVSGSVSGLKDSIAQTLDKAGVPPADAAVLAGAVLDSLTADMAAGVPADVAQANVQAALSQAAGQYAALSTGTASEPATVLAASLAQGGAGLGQAVAQATGGPAEAQGAALAAIQDALARGADPGAALASAADAMASALQMAAASAVPLSAEARAVAGLSGDSTAIQASVASLTSGLSPVASAAFADALMSQLAQGVDGAQALQTAQASAGAAGQLDALSAVPVERSITLLGSLGQGMPIDDLLAAMNIPGGRNGAAGQAAIQALSQGLAEGIPPAAALAAAIDAASTAGTQVARANAGPAEASIVALATLATDPAAALASLIDTAEMRSASPADHRVFLDALDRAIGDGLPLAKARAEAVAAVHAAGDYAAAAQVPSVPHSRLVQALATGQEVSEAAAETLPALAAAHLDQQLLLRTLLQPLGDGAELGTAVADARLQAHAAEVQLAGARTGLPDPDGADTRPVTVLSMGPCAQAPGTCGMGQ